MDKKEYIRRCSLPRVYLGGSGDYGYLDEENDMCYCCKTKIYMGSLKEAKEIISKYPWSAFNY